MEPSKLAPDQVKAKLDAGEPVTFLDDRSPGAWEASDVKLPGALRVPPGEVEQHLAEIEATPQGAPVVPSCSSAASTPSGRPATRSSRSRDRSDSSTRKEAP